MQLPFLHLQQELSSCGDSFLETDNYKGVDLEGGLNTVTNVSTALNWNLLSIILLCICW